MGSWDLPPDLFSVYFLFFRAVKATEVHGAQLNISTTGNLKQRVQQRANVSSKRNQKTLVSGKQQELVSGKQLTLV